MKQFDTFQVRIISQLYCLWKKQGTRISVAYAAVFLESVCVCVCLNYQENIPAERCRRNGETGDNSSLWAKSLEYWHSIPFSTGWIFFLEVYLWFIQKLRYFENYLKGHSGKSCFLFSIQPIRTSSTHTEENIFIGFVSFQNFFVKM